MAPLDELSQMPAVAASEVDHRFAGLYSGESKRGENVLAGELLRRESPGRLEEEEILVASGSGAGSCVTQNVPFSR
jgi:hypothetical protein